MLPDITVKRVEYGSADYRRMVDCRNAVLRIPLGRLLSPEELERDSRFTHYAAFSPTGEVLGTVLLDVLSETSVRARQVSVRAEAQGQGIGAKLMAALEEEARKRGCTQVVLHARQGAVPFYFRLGYVPEGEYFEESGLPHLLMRQVL